MVGTRTIPEIDLRKFPDRNEYKKLKESCEEWGCFRIINHRIPLSLMADMKEVVSSLLELPMEIKKLNSEVMMGSGYAAPSKANPLYESFGLYDFGSSLAVQGFCSQLKIASSNGSEIIDKYSKAMQELAIDIGGKMAESLGLTCKILNLSAWHSLLRMNKYNFLPESVGSLGVRVHTDSGFVTILQDDDKVGGLEVMNKAGQFVAIDPYPGTLLVNLGDIAKVWSNGRFCTVKHRVQCKEGRKRVSIVALLLGPKGDTIEAPELLVDSDHPRLYVPFTFEDYRKLRNSTDSRVGEALSYLYASNLENK